MKKVYWIGSSHEDLDRFPKAIRHAMNQKIKCKESSGNVFADLRISNPEEALAKAEIVRQIHKTIKRKKLTQAKAAKILGISQPKVSTLLRGYFQNFSLERLFRFLNKLGQDVTISISSELHKGEGHTRIGIDKFGSKHKIAALSK